ncbi:MULTISPECIES: TrlF family AAA-like ATPase [Halomonadaceae]|uniref:TrlF family AAA-like ATPase n=1 Tax=Halomonadaceae TaxID=28256 RepID=UPI00158208C2|nr:MULTISPECIES: hypothetical protein [Halomonas]MDI4638695.1 hypothetical protein [Halomonas sp. BMC7]NUJ59680.1 hypothetical protein [Halomonas taeanensis]
MNDPKGSLWRKWDMHVHTPYSILNNQFGEDFDEYVVRLFKSAIERGVEAIGITDYCIIDGYKKLVKDYLNDEKKLKCLFSDEEVEKIRKIAVFPNLEFRLNKLVIGNEVDLKWNRKTNFHVLLSNELTPEVIEEEFLSRVEFEIQAIPGQRAERRGLSKSNLEAYGRQLIDQHPKFSGKNPLAVGICNASVDSGEIADILYSDARLKRKYLLALPCDEDLSIVSWDSAGHGLRKTLIQQSQLVFSSNKNTRKFLLGGFHGTVSEFKKEFGLPKACIWGSDAHSYEGLFNPDENRNTWIKADLTFEGLKQVVFEPQFRVAIQETCPSKKTGYEVIDSVRFIDSSGKGLFQEGEINVNPELTSIIGGKSSGKSLLLYHIAKTANRDETEKKRSLAGASSYNELFDEKAFDFEVLWADGSVQRLKERNAQKPITYIPQLYINKLAEENGRDQLNELVLEVIFQDASVKQRVESLYKERDVTNERIGSAVAKLVGLRHQYSRAKKELENIGDFESVKKEIERINNEIERVQKSSGFTPEEHQEYKSLSSRLSRIEKRKVSIELFSSNLQELGDNLVDEIESSLSNVGIYLGDANSSPKISVSEKLASTVSGGLSKLKLDIQQEVGFARSRAEKLCEKLKAQEVATSTALEQFSKKIKSQEELKDLQAFLKKQELKLKSIEEAEKDVQLVRKQGGDIAAQLRNLYSHLFSIYKDMEGVFNDAADVDSEVIKLIASVEFDHDRFDSFIGCFDGRGSLSSLLGCSIDEANRYKYRKDSHIESIFEIVEKTRDFSKISKKVKKSVDEEALLRNLLQDCFYISFDLLYKDDDIISMSPGKRGLVLINLILHLSNSSHPILIDQPEDNLDNRTVYNELRDFVRERKVGRQIIMVTHNANMVVSTDSECVVVANQSGQQRGVENESCKFEYVSGAIEYTFINLQAPSVLKAYGIREHICEVLEGGQLAFEERERKYAFRS